MYVNLSVRLSACQRGQYVVRVDCTNGVHCVNLHLRDVIYIDDFEAGRVVTTVLAVISTCVDCEFGDSESRGDRRRQTPTPTHSHTHTHTHTHSAL